MSMTSCRHVEQHRAAVAAAVMWMLCFIPPAAAQDAPAKFVTPFSLDEMAAKQAIIETDRGQFIIDLLPKAAPNHVGYFIKSAKRESSHASFAHVIIRF